MSRSLDPHCIVDAMGLRADRSAGSMHWDVTHAAVCLASEEARTTTDMRSWSLVGSQTLISYLM